MMPAAFPIKAKRPPARPRQSSSLVAIPSRLQLYESAEEEQSSLIPERRLWTAALVTLVEDIVGATPACLLS